MGVVAATMGDTQNDRAPVDLQRDGHFGLLGIDCRGRRDAREGLTIADHLRSPMLVGAELSACGHVDREAKFLRAVL